MSFNLYTIEKKFRELEKQEVEVQELFDPQIKGVKKHVQWDVLKNEYIQDNDLFGFQPIVKDKEKKKEETPVVIEVSKSIKKKVEVPKKQVRPKEPQDPKNRDVFVLKSKKFLQKQNPFGIDLYKNKDLYEENENQRVYKKLKIGQLKSDLEQNDPEVDVNFTIKQRYKPQNSVSQMEKDSIDRIQDEFEQNQPISHSNLDDSHYRSEQHYMADLGHDGKVQSAMDDQKPKYHFTKSTKSITNKTLQMNKSNRHKIQDTSLCHTHAVSKYDSRNNLQTQEREHPNRDNKDFKTDNNASMLQISTNFSKITDKDKPIKSRKLKDPSKEQQQSNPYPPNESLKSLKKMIPLDHSKLNLDQEQEDKRKKNMLHEELMDVDLQHPNANHDPDIFHSGAKHAQMVQASSLKNSLKDPGLRRNHDQHSESKEHQQLQDLNLQDARDLHPNERIVQEISRLPDQVKKESSLLQPRLTDVLQEKHKKPSVFKRSKIDQGDDGTIDPNTTFNIDGKSAPLRQQNDLIQNKFSSNGATYQQLLKRDYNKDYENVQ